jgi:hypothetical protein
MLFSLPAGTEMFHFPAFPPHALYIQAQVTENEPGGVSPFGNPRITARLPAPRGLSQAPTSFIGSWCQGIHRVPLQTCTHKSIDLQKQKMLASTMQFSSNPQPRPPHPPPQPPTHPPRDEPATEQIRVVCPEGPARHQKKPTPNTHTPNQPAHQHPPNAEHSTPNQGGPVPSGPNSVPTTTPATTPTLQPRPRANPRPDRRTSRRNHERQSVVDVPPMSNHPQDTRPRHGPLNHHPHTHKRCRNNSLGKLLRKEVIQPHLPVRLPCYDFVPIASPTFDGSPPYGLGHRLRVLPTFVT